MKGLLAIVGALGVAVTGVTAFPSAAEAAPNPGIVISDVTLATSDGGQATVGDTLTVSGAWDATAADPQPGDVFTIGLPPELGFEQAVPFNLDGPTLDGDVVTWATCLTDPGAGIANCTLTEHVATYPLEVGGTFEFEVVAEEATDATSVIFDLNGTETPVELPGGGGIDDGVVVPHEWNKSGVLNGNKWSMTWTINLPGAALAGHGVVNVFDDLSDNHRLCDPVSLRVETVRGDAVVDVTQISTLTTSGLPDPKYDFGLALTAPEGGFDPNVTYRITYTTCTPDEQIDPKGTEYTNEATVDIFPETSGVIGVTQDWNISADVAKSGSVLGGADRNGVIRWTVTVAGDHLAGKNGFDLSEALTGAHAVCADTIDGIRVHERYGPSNAKQTEITGKLSITETSASTDAFAARVDVVDPSFAFKPSNYQYLIQYRTCGTIDGLPEGGTEFGNSVNVDGEIATSTPKAPGRTDQKTGGINTAAVTLDGVEHLPQTTMNWNITVPGERLDELAGDLTVTDTLSGAHQVCEAGDSGDVVDRLGLRVQARDQIQNGGLATVDLSDGVTASLDGETITISIPRPTLPVPGGGEQAGFSKEYQYVISYTTCTTSGGMDAPGTAYGNSATVEGKTYEHSVTQSNRGSGTGQGVARGSFAIEKGLADTAGAGFVPDDATFTVHVKEIDPNGSVQLEYDLQVPLNGDAVSGLNSRGTGWTVELSEPNLPSVPGVTWGAPAFAASPGVTPSADGTTAIVALDPKSNVAVSLENSALLGSVQVEKVIQGGAAALVGPDTEFAMTARIDVSPLGASFPAQPDRAFTVKAGEPYTLTDLPIGAIVTVTETLPADDDLFTWSPAVVSPERIEVLADHASEPGIFTVTNTVERSVGTFTLVKQVEGEQAGNPAVPADVTVTATWTDAEGTAQEKVLTVPTDGTPVPFGESLLVGTEVTLTETPLVDGSSIAWAAPVWSGTGVTQDGESAVVTIGRAADATVTLGNHAATSTAGISLIKGVAGAAAGEVADDTEFPVTATWVDADGVTQSRDLTINSVTPTELGEDLPAGTVVTITEGERPAFDTVVWGSITISGEGVTDTGDGSATVIVSDQHDEMTFVTVINEATWAPGTFGLSKEVVGVALDAPDVPETFTVVASWIDQAGVEQSTELVLPVDGTFVEFDGTLPYGTEVTLTEVAPADSDRFVWEPAEWAGDDALAVHDDGSAVLTIGAATVAEVRVTNTATAKLGTILLDKALTGDGAAHVEDGTTFPVTVTWTDLFGETQERDVEVTAGEPLVIDGLPLGTEIEFVEGRVDTADTIEWSGVEWSTNDEAVTLAADGERAVVVVTGEPGAKVTITLTNAFDEREGLASTGGDSFAAIVLTAIGLLAAGAIALVIRRRRAA
ncbi:hypothetical protein GCM10011490_16600 [Pseudoclavibacter endophyticus]|uniref:DUF5979 domain-containing protein n=1 Tax=Pseudoclavibacter endophyticus TaxID=1778590 RepID=A0A6H9WI37_9MICO|nr:DUF5979 domain-containing protein [Pseudoclavibacter endophyticus]KAB1648973.1 hypothetical protein F8O04_01380 [Pseudoclavibacter endophyticus]GGA66628.1 hypothetical protein GCM10011490_16600 [Pseudoclavibacter endophyticus]